MQCDWAFLRSTFFFCVVLVPVNVFLYFLKWVESPQGQGGMGAPTSQGDSGELCHFLVRVEMNQMNLCHHHRVLSRLFQGRWGGFWDMLVVVLCSVFCCFCIFCIHVFIIPPLFIYFFLHFFALHYYYLISFKFYTSLFLFMNL